jgi:hypothetical protein
VNVGSMGCLQAVGLEYELISADCEPAPQRIGAECEPKMALVCRSECRCLQAVTARRFTRGDYYRLLSHPRGCTRREIPEIAYQ